MRAGDTDANYWPSLPRNAQEAAHVHPIDNRVSQLSSIARHKVRGSNYHQHVGATINEWFGYSPDDGSTEAALAVQNQHCRFIDGLCKKRAKGGVCSITPTESAAPVVICPSRLYFNGHEFLAHIAQSAFASLEPALGSDGLPTLVKASLAREQARMSGRTQIGVFGQGWDSEVKLPASLEGGGSYSVDFTLVAIDPTGLLLGFAPVEVQTIDTTNNYKNGLDALRLDRSTVATKAGLNWENVSKRILPQLIVKGLMLQGERLCTHGIYFVTPDPVFAKIALRLGGMGRLRNIPKQPGSITFVRYGYDGVQRSDGTPSALEISAETTISTSDMSIAFISPQNLPPAGAYEDRISRKLAAKPSKPRTPKTV